MVAITGNKGDEMTLTEAQHKVVYGSVLGQQFTGPALEGFALLKQNETITRFPSEPSGSDFIPPPPLPATWKSQPDERKVYVTYPSGTRVKLDKILSPSHECDEHEVRVITEGGVTLLVRLSELEPAR